MRNGGKRREGGKETGIEERERERDVFTPGIMNDISITYSLHSITKLQKCATNFFLFSIGSCLVWLDYLLS